MPALVVLGFFGVFTGVSFAIASYLLGITLGLATIIYVIRFQTVRVRELGDPTHS